MLSSRICVLCRLRNSDTFRRVVLKHFARDTPTASSTPDPDQRKGDKDYSKPGPSSAFGSKARAKWEPLVKSDDLMVWTDDEHSDRRWLPTTSHWLTGLVVVVLLYYISIYTRPFQKENILTIPNALCLSRIALSPLLGYFVVNGNYTYGLAIFAYAAVTDLMDGWIARAFPSQQSVLGSALDPVADKVLISVLVLSLTYVGLIPLPLTVLIVTRDLGLVTTGFIMRYITLERPKTLVRYFDVTAPSVRMKPTGLSKFNTGVQLGMVGLSLAAPIFDCTSHPALFAVWYLTAGTTIASGLSYVFAKDTYEVLKRVKRESDKH